MDSKSIWFEVTIAGAVHLSALAFVILRCFNIYCIPAAVNIEHYLPYISALVVGFSYIIGLAVHYAIPIVGNKVIPRPLRAILRHQAEPAPSLEIASLTVKAILYGNEVLYQMRKKIYSVLVLFRLLSAGFLFLGISVSWWLQGASVSVLWWLPALIGTSLCIMFAWLYSLQYPSYASTERGNI